MSLLSRLNKIERLYGRDSAAVTRFVWVQCRVKIGDSAEHESYWSLLPFEDKHGTHEPQGVSVELINGWQRHGDLVVVVWSVEYCATFMRLPYEWPSYEVLAACIEADQITEWRDYQRGSLWTRYCIANQIC